MRTDKVSASSGGSRRLRSVVMMVAWQCRVRVPPLEGCVRSGANSSPSIWHHIDECLERFSVSRRQTIGAGDEV